MKSINGSCPIEGNTQNRGCCNNRLIQRDIKFAPTDQGMGFTSSITHNLADCINLCSVPSLCDLSDHEAYLKKSHLHLNIYIYIYIYIERERERGSTISYACQITIAHSLSNNNF